MPFDREIEWHLSFSVSQRHRRRDVADVAHVAHVVDAFGS
jgi:hypothetical protein